jgi:rhamnogalacturonyl hydrolase YesR
MRHLFLGLALSVLMPASGAAARFACSLTTSELETLAAEPSAALQAPIATVVDKSQPSPSGNAHDYVSFARYFWPDPTKPDGLPYISRDGQHNLEQVGRGDHPRLWNFFTHVEKLAAAWRVNHDEAAARRAGMWLRTWFVDPATRMTPHLDYAQVRLGNDGNRGAPYGLIDARGFSKVVDALLLLSDSPALSKEDEQAVERWFAEYFGWLTTSKNALAERAAQNNHGSWYLAQAIPIARYVGRDDLAREFCEENKALIAAQFQPDGSQPGEISRVDGLGYSVFNLEAHAHVARYAAALGIDMWNYTAPNGANLRRGLEFLRPYNSAPEKWPHSQRARLSAGFLDTLLREPEIAGGGAAASADESLKQLAREQFVFAAEQYAGLLKRIDRDDTRLPRTISGGEITMIGATDWTSGFFPGSLWLIYEQTKDPAFRAAAENFTKRVESIQHFTGHHDVGFMLGCSYGEGWRITQDPAYHAVLVQGARSLATRFSPETGVIRAWDEGAWRYPVIVDNMMNLGLLWFAYAETREESFREITLSHARKTQANHFRDNGSTFHLVDYDPVNGSILKRQTVQGFADDSAWARGQAWALTGFAALARVSKDRTWLSQSQKVADFVLNHPHLPADGIPYWDFDATDIPNAPRDASSAAVMAVGLLDLAQQLGEPAGAPYRALAARQLRSLAGPAYRAALNQNGNFLLMHSVGHRPQNSEVDVPLNYADYYFLKACALVLGQKFSTAGVP